MGVKSGEIRPILTANNARAERAPPRKFGSTAAVHRRRLRRSSYLRFHRLLSLTRHPRPHPWTDGGLRNGTGGYG